jgi:N-acetylmuramoyl-L-alanine amidase
VRIFSKISFISLLVFFAAAQSFAADITALRAWRAPDNTRLVFDLSAPVQYRISPDSSPARLIIEIDDTQPLASLILPAAEPPLKSLRFEKRGNGQRLIIDTTVELSPKIFQLAPNEKYGHRLVLDLYDKYSPTTVPAQADKKAVAIKADSSAVLGDKKTNAAAMPLTAPPMPGAAANDAVSNAAKNTENISGSVMKPAFEKTDVLENVAKPDAGTVNAINATSAPNTTSAAGTKAEKSNGDKNSPENSVSEKKTAVLKEPISEKFDSKRYRNIIVAIDAGHGGEDPGASGLKGTHEKNITLAIARELEAQLRMEPGITPVLTRSGDYFIPLQERRRIARYQEKADIFVSVHADAAENRSAKGASVFALSVKGAGTATSRFARMLAERENRSDLIGGAVIEKDDVLRNVLADMVVAGSLEHSLHMGGNILTGLSELGPLHNHNVEQAGFAVLKEPGMVSLLVETGFISNPEEERKLNDKDYQRDLARAIAAGVRRYCTQYPAPNTYFSWVAEKNRKKIPVGRSAAVVAVAAPVFDAEEKNKSGKAGTSGEKYRKHRVQRGENLTLLAEQYRVSMNSLREANHLKNDNVMIGQVLKIPTDQN